MEKLSISGLREKYNKHELSPVEYTQYMLNRIHEQDDMNIFINVTDEKALADAKRAEQAYMDGSAGALAGIPIAIKDIVYTKGIPTTLACEAYKDKITDEDAYLVKRLEEAGYCMVGKTNTSQFALGPTGEFSHIGPCRNPHDKTRITGGSSSGSAAAVAGFLVPGAIGSDTGGSIRIPSALCGVVGLKPTFGRVSKEGVFALSAALDTMGPLTRSVEDNALILNQIAGYNPSDWYSVPAPTEDYTARLKESIKGMKIAVGVDWFEDEDIEEDSAVLFNNALNALKELGAQLKVVHFPDLTKYRRAHQMMIFASAWHACEDVIRNHKDTIFEQPWHRMLNGNFAAKEYLECARIREEFLKVKHELMGDCEVMIIPSAPVAATPIGADTAIINGKEKEILTLHPKFTWMSNFSGFPAISLPVGLNREKMPIGISVIGKPFDEANVYRVAGQLENMIGYDYTI